MINNNLKIEEIVDIINLKGIKNKVEHLADANFKCFQANMQIIKLREGGDGEHIWKQVSDNEYIARTVGEKRVSIKAQINSIITAMCPKLVDRSVDHWADDDIVYSVGEMVDRILIEGIKQTYFLTVEESVKYKKSYDWQNRVLKFLRQKMTNVRQFGYESIEETRTYQ